jgi:Cu(I)/Ag(I) efflux system membrane fusion protein
MTRIQRFVAAIAAAAVLLGTLGLGYWWGHRPAEILSPTAAGPAEGKVLYWYDPMVPDQHFAKPGKSPFMDMPLVPKYAEAAGDGGIAIASDTQQNLGIRTVVVRRGALAGAIRVPGTIGWDLRQERVVSARVDTIVDRLFVKTPFEPVRAGQPLVAVIAPAWSTAIAESRALGEAHSAAARSLQSAASARLRVLGLPAGASQRDGRIILTSPVRGVVSEIGVREGQSAPMGTLLFRINGTETVWLEAAVPQAALAGIAPGSPVEARVSAIPGRVFNGRIDTLLPQIESSSRTQRARIMLDNADGALAPGMFAEITLAPTAGNELPLVPSDALIGAGTQSRIIVQGEDGRFRPVSVETGRSSGGSTEIVSGLKGGERVVASGQFLIDSEASLSGALERLNADGPAPAPAGVPRAQAPVEMPKRKVLYWYDPMVPDQHFAQPGKSPMGMEMVPKYADEAAEPQP